MMNTPPPSLLYLCQFQDINLMKRNILLKDSKYHKLGCDITMTIAL